MDTCPLNTDTIAEAARCIESSELFIRSLGSVTLHNGTEDKTFTAFSVQKPRRSNDGDSSEIKIKLVSDDSKTVAIVSGSNTGPIVEFITQEEEHDTL